MNETHEKELQVFINGALHYFQQVSTEDAEVKPPYLLQNDVIASDYTGIIGISGIRNGSIYYTAPKAMLHHNLLALGERQTTDELYNDLVGEIANTISGNARRELGSDFIISVPDILQSEGIEIKDDQSYKFAIPIRWKAYTSSLVIKLH